ncbi:MAG: carboxypeptidase regulatory-like domain-containing protein [candidate division KSB1 bacterium]|nr:carboxypeptidase regulatory-like domain-containing protein [candidate division KSB1 bacterium]
MVVSDEFVVNANRTLRHVFVYLAEGVVQKYPPPGSPVVLNQIGCQYQPHVFGIQTGQSLLILNSDDTMHNVHAAAKHNPPFNLGMTRHVKQLTRTFIRPEVMIPFRCNVHPWMSAYAGVLEHPFFQVTDTTGSYRLGPLPAGAYQVVAWHEKLGRREQRLALGDSAALCLDFTFVAH